MEFLNDLLPIIIYVLLIVLIILLIIISVKAIKMLNKTQEIVDNVDKKVKALDGVFEIIEGTTNKITLLSSRIVDIIVGAFEKVFKPKKKKEEIEEDE